MSNKKKQEKISKEESQASHLTSDNAVSFQEVSFDVLEKAVEKRNKKFGYKSKDFSGRAIISSDEVLPTKKRIFKRRANHEKKSNTTKLAVAVLVMILIFGIVAGGLSYLNSSGFFYRPEESTELKNAIYSISDYDYYLIELNEVLENPISEQSVNNSKINKEKYDQVKKDLMEINDEIYEIANGLDVNSDDYLFSGFARQTIESRIMMIDTGLKIYDKSKDSINVIIKTENFWQNIIKADVALKESDNLVESNDVENYKQAKKKSEEAYNYLNEAKSQIPVLNSMTKAFDFNTYGQYIDAKMEAAKLSADACQALIDQDISRIASTNIAYIEKSNQASELAKKMSSTPVQVLRTNYDLDTRPLIEEFKAARRNAADNDYVLRSYLYS